MSASTSSHARRSAGRRARWASGGIIAAKVIGALLSASLIVAFGYGWKNLRDLDTGLVRARLPSLNQPAAPVPGETAPSGTTPTPAVQGSDENILIVGVDDRSNMTPAEIKLLHVGHDQGLNTDVMLIVHVPADGSKASLLSIPRDSYVDIPGYSKNKINAAYVDGYANTSGSGAQKQAAGADLLIRTVTNLTGLNITRYVQVGFVGFYRIAQAIDGITVDMCQATDDSTAANNAAGLQGGSGFVSAAGVHHLTPVQSLEFVRQRHFIPGGDLGRAKRQRYFITAAFRKIASAGVLLNPVKLHQLVQAVDKSFYVDAGFSITKFAGQMANLSANNIVGHTIPTAGLGSTDVGDVVFVDLAKVRAFAMQMVNGTLQNRSSGKHPRAGAAKPKPIDSSCIH